MNATPQRLVVIEADPSGLTRGASFDPAARDAVAKALAGTAAVIFLVDVPKLDQIDADFPQGKLAATGKPTLTPIKKATYDRLVAVSTPPAPVPPPPAMPERPDPYAALKPGSIVLASESKEDGWWEAAVVKLEQNGATLRLKWVAFPDYDEFTKPLHRVAILPAGGHR
jgi:hypothetical protein